MSEPGLPVSFYQAPAAARTTMATKELRAILLATGGRILVDGNTWEIKARHMAAGVYEVSLVSLGQFGSPADAPTEEAKP